MSLEPGRALWRLGYHASPLDFPPRESYAFNHRFDDVHRRFRTLYCAEFPETCLREVLADFRPNLAARQRHIDRYGLEAAEDLVTAPVTAQWRRQHVLVAVELQLAGELVDLTDISTRQEVEDRHLELLLAYGLEHLDLHEITTLRRPITQTIAADLFDQGAAAVRFPSRLDGNSCVALFEGRGTLIEAGEPIALTDPAPEPLINVTAAWQLAVEPAPAATVAGDPGGLS